MKIARAHGGAKKMTAFNEKNLSLELGAKKRLIAVLEKYGCNVMDFACMHATVMSLQSQIWSCFSLFLAKFVVINKYWIQENFDRMYLHLYIHACPRC